MRWEDETRRIIPFMLYHLRAIIYIYLYIYVGIPVYIAQKTNKFKNYELVCMRKKDMITLQANEPEFNKQSNKYTF